MFKCLKLKKIFALLLVFALVLPTMGTFAAALTGGAVTVSATETTVMYAFNNLNVTERDNLTYSDIKMGWKGYDKVIAAINDGTTDNTQVVIGAAANGNSWSYTLNIPDDNTYYIDVLGWSGWSGEADATDAGGRFTLQVDDTELTNGKNDTAIILPAWGEKSRYTDFSDADKVRVGKVELTAGTHTMTFTMDNCASGHAGIHKIYITPRNNNSNGVLVSPTGDTVIPATEFSTSNKVEQSTWGTDITTMKAPDSWAGDGWYMTYDIYVEEPGTYHVGVRQVHSRGGSSISVGEQLYDAPSISVSVSDGSAETKLKGFKGASAGGSTFADTGLLPLNHAGYIDLDTGEYAIKLSGASYASHFQSIIIGSVADDNLVSESGTTSFSALSPVDGYYAIEEYYVNTNGTKFVAFNYKTDWNPKWVDWRVSVPDGADGWYDVWFNAGEVGNGTTNLFYDVRLDGKTMDRFRGKTQIYDPDLISETNRASVYLSAGIHTIGVYDGSGGQGIIHFQTVNLAPRTEAPLHELTAETRVSATGWADKSHMESIYPYLHPTASNAMAVRCRAEGGRTQYLEYKVMVPKGGAGWYNLKLGITAWSLGYGNPPVWSVSVNDGTDIGNVAGLGASETEASFTYDAVLGLAADPDALLPACELAEKLYLGEGQNTVRVHSTNANETFIQYLLFTKTDTDKIAAEINADNQTDGTQIIECENFSTIYGGARRAAPWNYNENPGVYITKSGSSTYPGGVGYKINVTETGTYNIGVAAGGPNNSANAYMGVFVDGSMRGFVIPQINSAQFTPTPQWVRSVELTAGTHEIHLATYYSYMLYADNIVLQKTDYGYNNVAQGITYVRDVDAKQGYADGTITVTPASDTTDVTGYHLYWGNENGRLNNYSAFGYLPADPDGTVAVYEIEHNLRIPQEATKILVYTAKNIHSVGTDKNGSTATSMIESASYISADLPDDCKFTYNEDEKLFSFWVMADTHVEENWGYWSAETKRALEQIMEIDSDAIGIFHAGDVTKTGAEGEWAFLQSGFEEIVGDAMPMYVTSGNHDEAWGQGINQKSYLEYAELLSGGRLKNDGKPYYCFKENGCYFIFLGDENGDYVYGPSDEQLDWLESLLNQAEGEKAPAFIFTHYILDYTAAGGIGVPMTKNENGETVTDPTVHFTKEAEERYRNLVENRENLIIFNGHDHEPFSHWYSIYDEEGATHLPLPSASIRFGDGKWNANAVLSDGTQYNNYYTNKSGMYCIEVYNGYILAKGWDIDTKTWDGSAQALIKTDYAPVSLLREGNTLKVQKNLGYQDDFNVIVAVYEENALAEAVVLSAETQKIITLPTVNERSVKVFIWKDMDQMVPICNFKDIE